MLIYRPGAVTREMIEDVAGPVEVFESRAELRETPAEALPSPGVGLRHYAPKARLLLIETDATEPTQAAGEVASRISQAAFENACERVGVMLPDGIPAPEELFGVSIFNWGHWDTPEVMAQRLYAGLRRLDELGCTLILCPVPPHDGIGAAIRDRLMKAGTKGLRD